MTPGTYPLTLYRGDSYHWQFVLWADAAKTIPADLTGVTVRSQFREGFDGAVVYEMPCVVALPNTIDANLPAADCADLPAAAVWDLELTYGDGTVATILAGQVTVRHDVTAATP